MVYVDVLLGGAVIGGGTAVVSSAVCRRRVYFGNADASSMLPGLLRCCTLCFDELLEVALLQAVATCL